MSIQTKTTPAGVRFDVVYRDANGKQVRKRFANRREAEQHEREQRVDVARGVHVDRRNSVTVTEYARLYVDARNLRESSRERMRSVIVTHIEPSHLGARRLVDVKPTEVQAWATSVSGALAPSSARWALRFLRSVFASAVYDQVIGRNPAERVRLERHDNDEPIVPLTVEQVTALADAVPERCRAMVLTQAGTGLRISELLALTTDDVEWPGGRTLTVSAQLRKATRVPPKSRHCHRTIPLPSWLVDVLAEHLSQRPATGEPAFLFRTTRRTPYALATYADVLERGVQRAGLPAGTTSHDLRHHYASVLLAQGVAPIVVARLLGHADATLVHRTYGHVLPDAEDTARAALEAAWTCAATRSRRAVPASEGSRSR